MCFVQVWARSGLLVHTAKEDKAGIYCGREQVIQSAFLRLRAVQTLARFDFFPIFGAARKLCTAAAFCVGAFGSLHSRPSERASERASVQTGLVAAAPIDSGSGQFGFFHHARWLLPVCRSYLRRYGHPLRLALQTARIVLRLSCRLLSTLKALLRYATAYSGEPAWPSSAVRQALVCVPTVPGRTSSDALRQTLERRSLLCRNGTSASTAHHLAASTSFTAPCLRRSSTTALSRAVARYRHRLVRGRRMTTTTPTLRATINSSKTSMPPGR